MPYSVDFSSDHLHVDGVDDAQHVSLDGNPHEVKVRPASLTRSDLNGPIIGVAPGDRVFIMWGLEQEAEPNSTLRVGTVSYTIIGAALRGDAAQQRVVCRKQVQ